MNILFLTAATGGGHVIAAQALMRQMEKQLCNCKTLLVDSLKYISPALERLITGTYLYTVKNVPRVYGSLYGLSEKNEAVTNLVKSFNYALSHKLLSLFEQYRPAAAICTHTMPLQMLSCLKTKGLLNIPVIGIVTDYTNHFFWKLEGVDAFIVAHEFIKNDMVKMGVRESSIYTFGIPVLESFLAARPAQSLQFENLGLQAGKPTLLLMGGSLGFGDMLPVFYSLIRLRREIQIIAVAGRNEKLEMQLKSLAYNSVNNIHITGYTNKVSELMDMSSLIITKPGGITISEALVKKLPILIMKPLPGQEERNAGFLCVSGAAVRLMSYDDMEAVLKDILDKPAVLKKMSEAAGKLAKPRACEDIARLAEELIYQSGQGRKPIYLLANESTRI